MPQVEIDVSQIEVDSLPEKSFPAIQPFRIHLSEQAHAEIWKHARGTLLDGDDVKEVGGILVGNIYKDSQGPFLDVKGAIVAEHTRNEGTEVAFTPETWHQINKVKDELYSDDRIVGWYHTHPRFGIFLSERDKFIQQHSFSQPWATAFVVDPVQKTEGFFFWSEGEPKEAPEYWVGPEHRQCLQSEKAHAEDLDDSGSREETRAAISQASLALALTVGLLSLLFAFGYSYWRDAKRFERDKIILRGLESQRAELDRSLQTMVLVKSKVNQAGNQATTPAGAQAAAPDERTQDRMRELETGLRRLGVITLLLEAAVTGQEQIRSGTPEGNNPEHLEPATRTPDGNTQ